MPTKGSAPNTVNKSDYLNVFKHIILVAGAAAFSELTMYVTPIFDSIGLPVLIPLVTGGLTLLTRYLQDNAR